MHFVYLVCCAGFPFVDTVLVLFVAIVWFALRCVYLFLFVVVVVFFSVCGCCSLAYFLLIYFCLLLSVVSVVYFLLVYFYFATVLLLFGLRLHTYSHTRMHTNTHAHKHIGRAPGVFGSSFV